MGSPLSDAPPLHWMSGKLVWQFLSFNPADRQRKNQKVSCNKNYRKVEKCCCVTLKKIVDYVRLFTHITVVLDVQFLPLLLQMCFQGLAGQEKNELRDWVSHPYLVKGHSVFKQHHPVFLLLLPTTHCPEMSLLTHCPPPPPAHCQATEGVGPISKNTLQTEHS